jgi:ELWxxDGT repeat protein
MSLQDKRGHASDIARGERIDEKYRGGRASEMAGGKPNKKSRAIFIFLILAMSSSFLSLYMQLDELKKLGEDSNDDDDDGGANGTDGKDGNIGANGLTSLLLITDLANGSSCANGGLNISAGLDSNGDGILTLSEVEHNNVLCHGETGTDGNNGTNGDNGSAGNNGSDGFSALSRITPLEANNATCPGGGIEISIGMDNDRDGILDAEEVTDSQVICNGIDGNSTTAHAPLMATVAAPPTFCPDGLMLRFGIDDGDGGGIADDGILQSGEADEVFTICTGTTAWNQAHPDSQAGVLSGFSTGCSQRVSFESNILFSAISSDGCELWVSDGTVSGTSQITDINPSTDSAPGLYSGLFSADGLVWFDADDGTSGRELWVSNGTVSGTVMVADIAAGSGDSNPAFSGGMASHEGKVWFNADDGVNGRELWVSNGTQEGTMMVADICPGACSSNSGLSGMVSFDGGLWFTADDGVNGSELWTYDGSSATMVADINSGMGSGDSNPGESGGFAVFKERLWFDADDGLNGRELWSANSSGAVMLSNLATGADSSLPGKSTGLVVLGDSLVFRTQDTGNPGAGNSLWYSDGTSGGTAVLDANLFDIAPSGSNVYVHQGIMWFACESAAAGEEICSTDGTSGGTQIHDLIVGAGGEMSPAAITVAHGWLYFTGEGFNGSDATGLELWRIQLTGGAPELVWDVFTGDGNNADVGKYGGLVTVENTIFFSADNGMQGHELYHWGEIDPDGDDVLVIT